MKKVISILLAFSILLSLVSVPAFAADIAAGVHLKVEFNKATGIVTLSGTMAEVVGRNWATYYLLNPGKTRSDLKNHTLEDPVFSNYGEFEAESDGTFKYTFKITGAEGVYTLYFTTGYAHITREIDTSKDLVSEPGRLEAIKSLGKTYAAQTSTDVKELFNEKVRELPKEMPVVRPAKIDGLREIFVSIYEGNDATATGEIDKPFKTIKKALEKNPPETGMVLYLCGGTYPMTDGLALKDLECSEELPFIISNYNNEEVIITGGEEIKGSDFEQVTEQNVIKKLAPSVIDKIRVVDLKNKYGMTEYGDITKSSQPVLMGGESKYQIARWPNSEETVMREYTGEDGENGVIDSGWYTIAVGSECGDGYREYSKRVTEKIANGEPWTDADNGIQFCIEDIRPFSWEDTGDIWIHGKFYDDWTIDHLKISEFHPENRSIRTTDGIEWGARYLKRDNGYQNKFYYYNVLEELDNPGEWFMDKEAGKLYVYPTGDLTSQKITYAYEDQEQMFSIRNCKNVIVNGIRFSMGSCRGISIEGPRNEGVIVQNCTFDNLNTGVYIQGNYSGVIDSTFKDLDDKGVRLAGNSTAEIIGLQASRLFVQNSVFYNTTGISNNGVGNIISHNFISNNKGTCIHSAGNEHVIEYNEITAGPRGTVDSGCIYVNGNNLFSRGTHVRYNYVHDGPYSESRGIYFDDMLSENYGYGNILDGVWFQIHTGSENAIYNNIMLNYNNSAGNGPLRIDNNYWHHATVGETRWKTGALEYGSFSNKLLKSTGYGGDEDTNTLTGPYADRYPLLKEWAELMYKRIDEYNKLIDLGHDEGRAAKTSSETQYTHTYYPYANINYKQTENVDLNEYLAAVRDTYVANNVMINTGTNVIDSAKHTSGTNVGKYKGAFGGYIRTVDENNVYLKTEQNPFTDKDYSDADTKLASYISGFEEIPFDKIGLLSEEYYTVNGKTNAITPVDTVEVAISGKDLSLQWSSVPGAQKYTVTLASDAEFNYVLESDTTFDLSYKVKTSLESDKTYYWKVETESNAKCSTGEVQISDTFKFKTMVEGVSVERNQVGVTVYSVDDMTKDNFKVTTYAYNTTDADKDATIHIACYDENGKLVSTKNQTVTVPADSFTSEIVFDFNAPNTKKIKLFVWSADNKLKPYTFVKTIEQ